MANSTSNNTFAVLIEFEKWHKKQGIMRKYTSNLKSVQKDIYDYLTKYPWKEGIRTRGVTIRKECYTTPYKEL